MPEKPLLGQAMERAGESKHGLARATNISFAAVQQAACRRIDAEKAGKICRYLADEANLSVGERKALFTELVSLPGRSEELHKRVSTEDPMENLWESFRRN